MKSRMIHEGPNGLGIWICSDSEDPYYIEVSFGCFRFHMNLESLDSLLEGLSKAWFEIHKDNHANCGCGQNDVTSLDNPFNRKWGGGS